ncbi:MAG: hypothetical protein AAFO88_01865, partial [Pseudomonadota bacterium]
MTKRIAILLAGAASLAVLTACEDPGEVYEGEPNEVTEAEAVTPPPPPPPAPPPPPPAGKVQAMESVIVTGRGQSADMAVRSAPSPMVGVSPPQQVPQPMPGDVDRERFEDVE